MVAKGFAAAVFTSIGLVAIHTGQCRKLLLTTFKMMELWWGNPRRPQNLSVRGLSLQRLFILKSPVEHFPRQVRDIRLLSGKVMAVDLLQKPVGSYWQPAATSTEVY